MENAYKRNKKIGEAFHLLCDGESAPLQQNVSVLTSPEKLGDFLAKIVAKWSDKDVLKVNRHDFVEPIELLNPHWKLEKNRKKNEIDKVKLLKEIQKTSMNDWSYLEKGNNLRHFETLLSWIADADADDENAVLQKNSYQESTYSISLSKCLAAYCVSTMENTQSLKKTLMALSLMWMEKQNDIQGLKGVVNWCRRQILTLSDQEFEAVLNHPKLLNGGYHDFSADLVLRASRCSKEIFEHVLNDKNLNVFNIKNSYRLFMDELDVDKGLVETVVSSDGFKSVLNNTKMISDWLSHASQNLHSAHSRPAMTMWVDGMLSARNNQLNVVGPVEKVGLLDFPLDIQLNCLNFIPEVVGKYWNNLLNNIQTNEEKVRSWSLVVFLTPQSHKILKEIPSDLLPSVLERVVNHQEFLKISEHLDEFIQSLSSSLANECLMTMCRGFFHGKKLHHCSALVEQQYLSNSLSCAVNEVSPPVLRKRM